MKDIYTWRLWQETFALKKESWDASMKQRLTQELVIEAIHMATRPTSHARADRPYRQG